RFDCRSTSTRQPLPPWKRHNFGAEMDFLPSVVVRQRRRTKDSLPANHVRTYLYGKDYREDAVATEVRQQPRAFSNPPCPRPDVVGVRMVSMHHANVVCNPRIGMSLRKFR